jgi:hypothetical protein
MKKIILSAIVVSLVFFAVSCQKGDDGPAGAQGLTGPAGSTNTTVKKILFVPNWADSVYLGMTVNKDTVPDADINATVIDKGAVFVFFKPVADPQWYPLPYTAGFSDRDEFIHVGVQPGQVNLYAWQKDAAGVITNLTPSIDSLKYVIVLDRSVSGRGPGLTSLPFEELCRVLGIKP